MNTENCSRCNIEIDLVTSLYHEGMCKSCYWEYEDEQDEKRRD